VKEYFILVQFCQYLFKTQLDLQHGITSTEYLYVLTTNSVRSLSKISSFVIVMEMPCVYYELGIGCLYFICAKLVVPVLSASRIFGEIFGSCSLLYKRQLNCIQPDNIISRNPIYILAEETGPSPRYIVQCSAEVVSLHRMYGSQTVDLCLFNDAVTSACDIADCSTALLSAINRSR
jgi:hypothetical protein